jgi:hypothetical protein
MVRGSEYVPDEEQQCGLSASIPRRTGESVHALVVGLSNPECHEWAMVV